MQSLQHKKHLTVLNEEPRFPEVEVGGGFRLPARARNVLRILNVWVAQMCSPVSSARVEGVLFIETLPVHR